MAALGWGSVVSPRAVWCWGPMAGQPAMEPRQEAWTTVTGDHGPTPAPLTAEPAALPLVRGADGVRVPLRPDGGGARGQRRWPAVTGGAAGPCGPAAHALASA